MDSLPQELNETGLNKNSNLIKKEMRICVYILLIIIACVSCNNDDENPFGFTGTASAIKNGEVWNSNSGIEVSLNFDNPSV